jgi:hypothetical protein
VSEGLQKKQKRASSLVFTHLQQQGGLLIFHHTGQVQILPLDAQGYRYFAATFFSLYKAHGEHHWKKERGLVVRVTAMYSGLTPWTAHAEPEQLSILSSQ